MCFALLFIFPFCFSPAVFTVLVCLLVSISSFSKLYSMMIVSEVSFFIMPNFLNALCVLFCCILLLIYVPFYLFISVLFLVCFCFCFFYPELTPPPFLYPYTRPRMLLFFFSHGTVRMADGLCATRAVRHRVWLLRSPHDRVDRRSRHAGGKTF